MLGKGGVGEGSCWGVFEVLLRKGGVGEGSCWGVF